MVDVVQFIFCLIGFIGSLAAIVFVVIVFNEIRPYDVLEILFLALAVIVLCVIAVGFVVLATVSLV